MAEKIIKRRGLNNFTRVKALLPVGDSFHISKGPVIWVTKRHLQKIEKRLQLFEKVRHKGLQAEKMNHKNIQVLKSVIKNISQKNRTNEK